MGGASRQRVGEAAPRKPHVFACFARKVCLGLASVLAACACLASQAIAQEAPPPLEMFGRLPLIAAAAISPDGTKVALARLENGAGSIAVIDLDHDSIVFRARLAAGDHVDDIGWADDGHMSFSIRHTYRPLELGLYARSRAARIEQSRTGVADLDDGQMRLLAPDRHPFWWENGAPVIAPIEGDPGFGRMIGLSRDFIVVYRINLATGSTDSRDVPGATPDTAYVWLDARGAVIARADINDHRNRWRLFAYDGNRSRRLLEGVSDTGEPPVIAGLTSDGRLVAFMTNTTASPDTLVALDRTSGAQEILFRSDKGGPLDGALIDPWTRQVVGASWTEDEAKQHFFDPALQAIADQAKAVFGDGVVRLQSWSRDRRRVLLYVERGLDGGGYYVFTPASRQLFQIGFLYPSLAASPLAGAVREAITYRARDGVRIPAYLTLPPGPQQRNLPLVVLVHGGPQARDTMDFDWWATFLASRGYAVLQPNFRGSTGYGEAWERAGYRQWGGLMQTDVEDGVIGLAAGGYVDPARVCIVGASYGGYAALAGATLTPDRYRCAASVAGVSDLDQLLREELRYRNPEGVLADWERLAIGDRREDRDFIRSISPAFMADRVKIPILLMHGTNDTVVPISQSERMRDALTRAGKDVRYVVLEGDDHYLSEEATRIQMLRELETFLAQHLQTAAHAAPSGN